MAAHTIAISAGSVIAKIASRYLQAGFAQGTRKKISASTVDSSSRWMLKHQSTTLI